MASRINKRYVLAARPTGGATQGEFGSGNLTISQAEVPALNDGELLYRTIMVSVDPYQRNIMGNTTSETPPLQIGQTMVGPAVGVVEESRNSAFSVGDHVVSWSGWQQYVVSTGVGLRKLDESIAPLSTALGVLGHTGLTAWLGASKLMEPKPGGTFVVTNAAGSVGTTAAQLAKRRGHRVVGIAGGEQKVAYLRDELGLDAALDYKAETFQSDLEHALPDGVDRLLDSVGGGLFELLLPRFNVQSKVITIGQMRMYGPEANELRTDRLPDLLNLILYRKVEVRGMQLNEYFNLYPEFLAEMTPLVASGEIKYREEFVDGFENIPGSLARLFAGHNQGKLIVRIG